MRAHEAAIATNNKAMVAHIPAGLHRRIHIRTGLAIVSTPQSPRSNCTVASLYVRGHARNSDFGVASMDPVRQVKPSAATNPIGARLYGSQPPRISKDPSLADAHRPPAGDLCWVWTAWRGYRPPPSTDAVGTGWADTPAKAANADQAHIPGDPGPAGGRDGCRMTFLRARPSEYVRHRGPSTQGNVTRRRGGTAHGRWRNATRRKPTYRTAT